MIIYDRFGRFIVVKKSQDLSERSAIEVLLEVFSKHSIPSSIRSDHAQNFVSSEFVYFVWTWGSTLHLPVAITIQAECAISTEKDLTKWCHNPGENWRIAFIEFLCTPGPDIKSPSNLLEIQFCGILPMCENVTNNSDVDCFVDRKSKQKEIFDANHW